jgi:hypothetical protein
VLSVKKFEKRVQLKIVIKISKCKNVKYRNGSENPRRRRCSNSMMMSTEKCQGFL